MSRDRGKVAALLLLQLWTVAFHIVAADVTAFGCERAQGLSQGRVDRAFGSTCSESTQPGVDFSQLGTVIADGKSFLTSSDEECCQQCRETPGCRSWTRFAASGTNMRPQRGCWLMTAKVVDPDLITDDENANSGVLAPFASGSSTCVGASGFKADGVPYNEPSLLQVSEPEDCCLHCRAQAAICKRWSFDSSDNSCSLYSARGGGRSACPTCTTARRRDSDPELPDNVQQIVSDSCGDSSESGMEGSVLRGTPIATTGAFVADSSAECCHFCAVARECKSWSWDSESRDCNLFGDIPRDFADGKPLDRSGVVAAKVCGVVNFSNRDGIEFVAEGRPQGGANSQRPFPESDASSCGLRCQENPACRAWTFFSDRTECRLMEQPSLQVRRCQTCSSALYEERYATRRDRDILNDLEAEIDSIQVSPGDEPPTRGPDTDSPARSPDADAPSPQGPDTDSSARSPDAEGQPPSGSDAQSPSPEISIRSPIPPEDTAAGLFAETADEDPSASIETNGDSVDPGLMFGLVAALLLLLLCIPLYFQYRRYQRDKRIKEEREKIAHANHLTVHTAPVPGPSDPNAGRSDAVRGRQSPSTPKRETSGLLQKAEKSSSQGHIPILLEEQRNLIREVLRNSRGRQSVFQFRSGSSFKLSESVLDAVSNLEPGDVVANKYVVEPGTRIGQNNAIVKAHVKFGLETPVVLKFFKSKTEFDRESSFFAKTVSSNFLPDVLDIYDGDLDESAKMPPLCCIVLERGDMSLDAWLHEQTGLLDPMDQRNILYKITRALQFLHDNRIVHRDLKPGNIVVFTSNLFTLKLIDLGSACQRGQSAPIEYTLRYAAPELITAHLKNSGEIIAHPSADMWPLGLIFWELLVGEPLFGSNYSEEEVLAMLADMAPLPFERVPEMWNQIPNRVARRIVQSLLQRNPEARWTVHKVLNNAFFSTGHDTVAQEAQMEVIGSQLQQIAEGVTQMKQQLIKLEAISLENLKLNASQALLACISFYDIDPTEFSQETVSESYIIQKYQSSQLRCVEAPLEPNYNLFVRKTDEPTSLLKISHRHLVRITVMTAGEVKVDVPIAEIVWIKIWPSELEQDGQDCAFHMIKNEGHVIEGIAFWDTTKHRDLSLQLQGRTAVDVTIGFRLRGQQDITVVQKTVLLRMHPANTQFRTLKAFNRTRAFYSNLPQWAKIYIHGSITIAKLVL